MPMGVVVLILASRYGLTAGTRTVHHDYIPIPEHIDQLVPFTVRKARSVAQLWWPYECKDVRPYRRNFLTSAKMQATWVLVYERWTLRANHDLATNMPVSAQGIALLSHDQISCYNTVYHKSYILLSFIASLELQNHHLCKFDFLSNTDGPTPDVISAFQFAWTHRRSDSHRNRHLLPHTYLTQLLHVEFIYRQLLGLRSRVIITVHYACSIHCDQSEFWSWPCIS